MEKKTGQKNVRQKNKDWVLKYYIFLSHIFLSGLLLGSLFPSFPSFPYSHLIVSLAINFQKISTDSYELSRSRLEY